MADLKQIHARMATARTALEKGIGLADVIIAGGHPEENAIRFVRDELMRICGRLDAAAGIAENLIHREDEVKPPAKRQRRSIIEAGAKHILKPEE